MGTSASLGWIWQTSATVRELTATVDRIYAEGTRICKQHDRNGITMQSEFRHVKEDVAETKENIKELDRKVDSMNLLLQKIDSKIGEGP
jgi:hypothetical protein